jgi:hypothetical protein
MENPPRFHAPCPLWATAVAAEFRGDGPIAMYVPNRVDAPIQLVLQGVVAPPYWLCVLLHSYYKGTTAQMPFEENGQAKLEGARAVLEQPLGPRKNFGRPVAIKDMGKVNT